MLTIQPLRTEDLPAARRLSDAAGWNQLDADWLRLITLFPQTTLAGFLNNQLIATAALTQFAPIPGQCLHLAWIGVMLVDKTHRGAGHGSAMFDAALRCGADRGIIDYGLDATDLGRPLYLKRNFTDRLPITRWHNPTPNPNPQFPIPNTQYPTRPLQESDWDQILTLDRQATQTTRTPLLKHLAHEPQAQARVAEHSGQITGFALYRQGRIAHYIGPLIAQDPATALALFHSLLAHHNPNFPLFLDIPANSPLEPHLLQSHFTPARKLVRMARASTLCPLACTPNVYAISGLELC